MNWIKRKTLTWLQRDCDHMGHITADIPEGDWGNQSVQWCYRCGAYRMRHNITNEIFAWRKPDAEHAETMHA